MNTKRVFGCVILLFLLLLPAVFSLEIPLSLQKVIDYATQQAQSLSLLIAFLGGVLSILSPCILPILPAFFAYTFKERRQITKMTLVFFFGMASVFTLMGITAGFIGQFLEFYRGPLTFFFGFLFILFGFLIFFKKGFNLSFFALRAKPSNDVLGTFLFGVFFAFGFTPCIGTILTAILFLAATVHNYLYSGLLLFSYSLGILLPLFIIAFFYDKYNLAENKFIRGKAVTLNFFGKKVYTHTSNIIAGSLFVIMGGIFVFFRNTSVVNTLDPLRTKQYFYTLHNVLINAGIPQEAGNIFGILILIVIFVIIAYIIKKYNQNRKGHALKLDHKKRN